MSTVSWADASDIDKVVFTVLANPQAVDSSKIPEDTPRIEEMPSVPEEVVLPPTYVPPPNVYSYEEPRVPTPPPPPRPEETANLAPPRETVSPPRPCESVSPPRAREPVSPPRSPPREPPREPPRAPPEDERDLLTKRTVLIDLQQLQMQGVTLSKVYTMEDPLDEMMLEMRRHTLAMDEQANVNMMRDGLRIAVTGIEMLNNRIGLLDLEGWSATVCRDLERHDQNLSRIYRKYWRRSVSQSPEMDICLSILGSMGMHHMKRSMTKQLMRNTTNVPRKSSRGRPRAPSVASSSDEEAPP